MRFGFHVSIAEGFEKAVHSALKTGCRTLQIFSRNPRGWDAKPLDTAAAERFRQLLQEHDIRPLFVHMPYLPNLAAEDNTLYERSVKVLCEDLQRAQILGAEGLVLHLGHRGKAPIEQAIKKIAAAIDRACSMASGETLLLLENAAGQGSEIGSSFAQIQEIIGSLRSSRHIGVCLDTAHAFAAGYDVANKEGLEKTLVELDRLIGLRLLRLIHLNDSKTPLGSHIDRHWHIGMGCIGKEGLQRVIHQPVLSRMPAIMETPKKDDKDDERNMKRVLRLASRGSR